MTKLLAALILSVSGITVSLASVPQVKASEGFWHESERGSFRHEGDRHAFGSHLAPEIDPSSAFSAMTLLLGGLTVLRARVSKK